MISMKPSRSTGWLRCEKMSEKTHMSFYLAHNTFRIFTDAVRRIGCPGHVRFLMNPDDLRMAMESHDKKKLTSFKVPHKLFTDTKGTSMRIHSKRFCHLLAEKMEWDMAKSYRVPGEIFSRQQVVIFDLSQAVAFTKGEPDSPSQ